MRRRCDRVRDRDLVAYLANPDDEALRDVHDHVVNCEDCAAELRAWRTLRGDMLLDDADGVDDHPAPENLGAYCDDPGSLGPALRTEIQAHLSGCPSCRDETKVFAGMRIERAVRARQSLLAASQAESAVAMDLDDAFGAIPSPEIIEHTSLARRLRHPGVALALVLVMTLPVLGVFVMESGLPRPEREVGASGAQIGLDELRFDRATLTARPATPPSPVEADEAAVADARWERARTDVVSEIEEVRGDLDTGTAGADLPSLAQYRSVNEPIVIDGTGAAAAARDEAEAAAAEAEAAAEADADAEEFFPRQSVSEEVLSPEQLMAMLETERRVAEMRRRSIEIPDAVDDGVRRGAAIIETLPLADAPAGSLEPTGSAQAVEQSQSEDSEVRTAHIPPEQMIIGIRQLGTAPVRGPMLGHESSTAASSMAAEGADDSVGSSGESATRARGGFGLARIHFVRGSSYVFTRTEVERGMQIRFPLPKHEGDVTTVEARLFEIGTSRELVKRFPPPTDALQASPVVALDVPSGWLSQGRYSAVLTTPDVAQSPEQSINIRILDESRRAADARSASSEGE